MMSVGEVRALYYGAAVVEEGVWPFPITSSLLVGLSFFFFLYGATIIRGSGFFPRPGFLWLAFRLPTRSFPVRPSDRPC